MYKRVIPIVLSLVMVVTLTGIVGCAKPAGGAEPIVLGCPISFKATPWPLGGKYGWELAVDEINAAGGVNVGGVMRPFKLIVLDTRDEEPGVPVSECLLGIEKLILDDKVDVLVGGPSMSEASIAALDLVAKYDIVHLVTSGTWTPSWGKKVGGDIEKYRNSFKMSESAAHAVPVGLDLLEEVKKEHNLSKAYCIIDDCMFCRNAMDVFAGLGEKRGFTILGRDAVPPGSTDYSPALMKAKDSGADLLFFWTNTATSAILFKQFVDLEIPALPVGFAAGAQEYEVYKAVDGKCAYIIFPNPHACQTATKLSGDVQFQEAFESKFDKKPFGGCGGAYAGAYVLKDAIERAGSLDTDALITALEATNLMTVNGRLMFGDNHEDIYNQDPEKGIPTVYSQWINGERVAVWPLVLADSEIVLPPWMK